jgi:hypothetical protein
MTKKKTPGTILYGPLPGLVSLEEVQRRLDLIFPLAFPDRGILVGVMASRVIYIFLYGGFLEGSGRFLRPSNIYHFTIEQSEKRSETERLTWLATANKPGNRPAGTRWYADNSREPIRDDLMRNQLLRLGIMHKRQGFPTTASTPINCLSLDFAYLFDPTLEGEELAAAVEKWRKKHLDQATLQRMALRAQGIAAKEGDVFINMPDETRIRISAGPSSNIVKGLIEDFAARHLQKPSVLWISASDQKTYPQFVQMAASVGLKFHPSKELPDIIFADLADKTKFLFCEVVATDGAVTETRKKALLELIEVSDVPAEAVNFLTAFEDRQSSAFRKNFSQLALDSLVWFRTEPDLLVILSTANKAALDPEI